MTLTNDQVAEKLIGMECPCCEGKGSWDVWKDLPDSQCPECDGTGARFPMLLMCTHCYGSYQTCSCDENHWMPINDLADDWKLLYEAARAQRWHVTKGFNSWSIWNDIWGATTLPDDPVLARESTLIQALLSAAEKTVKDLNK